MAYDLRSRDISSPRKKFCQCTECGMQFFSDKEVDKHVKSVHSARGRYFCKKCGIRFSLKSQKHAHKKRFHAFRCLNCRKIFYSKRMYECHERNHLYNCENSIEHIDKFTIKVESTEEVESLATVSENRIEFEGASTSKVQNDIVPAEQKSKDAKSAPEPQTRSASSKVIDIMANVRMCTSCGTNFLLPRDKFREHTDYCKEYYRKKGVEKYYAQIDAAFAAAAPKKRSIDELSKEPVAQLVEPTVPTCAVATNSKKGPPKTKKSKVQKEISQNGFIANTGPTQTIEPRPKVSSLLSSLLSSANKVSVLSLPIASTSASVESVPTLEASRNVCTVPSSSSSRGQSLDRALNRTDTTLIRDSVKHLTYLCSHCSFTISNVQLMKTHFGRKHPSQEVEFAELVLTKCKIKQVSH